MKNTYSNFAELKQHAREDEDFTILYRKVDSEIAIIAPHGGGIEPGTSDIADLLAGCDYTFYCFKGLKKKGNTMLHLGSSFFDEERGLQAAQNARIVITVHGSKDKAERVHIGGKNQALKQKIMHALQAAGFEAGIDDMPGLLGKRSENICNRCKSGKGVQLEISRGLREKMFDSLDHRSLRKKTILFYQFVNAIREALLSE
jgi:phage replication-related protein YjqB (UPF0714/DUF867 family)